MSNHFVRPHYLGVSMHPDTDHHETTEARLKNARSRRWLLWSGIVFIVAWGLTAGFLLPAMGAPEPWTGLGMFILLGLIFMLISSRTPLAVELSDGSITFRHLVRINKIPHEEIVRVEYRVQSEQVDRPLDHRYYGVGVWSERGRRADVGLDGPVAKQLMAWFDPSLSILKVNQGNRVLEERFLDSESA